MLQDVWDTWFLAIFSIIKENETKEDKTGVQFVIKRYLEFLKSTPCSARMPTCPEIYPAVGRSPSRKRKCADMSTPVSPHRLAKRLRRLDKHRDEIMIPQCRRSEINLKPVIASTNLLKQLLLQGDFKTVYDTFDIQEKPELQYKNFSVYLRAFLIQLTQQQPGLNEKCYKLVVNKFLDNTKFKLKPPNFDMRPNVGCLVLD